MRGHNMKGNRPMAATKAVKKEPEQKADAGPVHDPTTEEQDDFDAHLVEAQQVEDQVPAEAVIAGVSR